MKKIFPFYKGKNIANNPLGYTNVTNARKRMDDYDVKRDFDKTLPIDYWVYHSYVYKLANPWREDFNENEWRINTSYGYYGIKYLTKGDVSLDSETYLKDLPNDIYDLFIRLSVYSKDNKEKYKEILFELLRMGWMPTIYKDWKDYKKRYSKFIKENIEFKEMDVNIEIK